MFDPRGSRPDWVMIGIHAPDSSVFIIASKELTSAELTAEADTMDIMSGWYTETVRVDVVRMRYLLSCDMRSYVIVHAPNYGAAFQHLFQQWSPEAPTNDAIAARRRLDRELALRQPKYALDPATGDLTP
jgi:hypothetical protein